MTRSDTAASRQRRQLHRRHALTPVRHSSSPAPLRSDMGGCARRPDPHRPVVDTGHWPVVVAADDVTALSAIIYESDGPSPRQRADSGNALWRPPWSERSERPFGAASQFQGRPVRGTSITIPPGCDQTAVVGLRQWARHWGPPTGRRSRSARADVIATKLITPTTNVGVSPSSLTSVTDSSVHPTHLLSRRSAGRGTPPQPDTGRATRGSWQGPQNAHRTVGTQARRRRDRACEHRPRPARWRAAPGAQLRLVGCRHPRLPCQHCDRSPAHCSSSQTEPEAHRWIEARNAWV